MKYLIILILLTQVIAPAAFACTEEEEEKIQIARDYIEVHANEVLDYLDRSVQFEITPRQRERYFTKVRSSSVKCVYRRSRCNGQRGRSFGRLFNSVSICPNKLHSPCEWAFVLAHEFGHAAGFPIGSLRAHNRSEDREHDILFALEARFKFICQQTRVYWTATSPTRERP